MANYFVPMSLNDSLTQGRKGVRAKRKTPMNPTYLAFEQLIKLMVEKTIAAGKSQQVVSNLTSALHAFMDDHGFTGASAIGSHLRNSYYKRLSEHVESLQQAGRDSKYIANRKSLLSRWHSLVLEIDRQYAVDTGTETAFQKLIKELVAAVGSQRKLAREIGMPLATLKRWIDGVTPQRNMLPKFRRIEAYFGMRPGVLVELVSTEAGTPPTTAGLPREIAYRHRLIDAQGQRISLTDVSDALKAEWYAFVEYKTELLPELRRSPAGRWRATNNHTKIDNPSLWFAFHDGLHVPTASINWQSISNYLGWLSLENIPGGPALATEKIQTIGWLLHLANLRSYISWYVKRSGGKVHGGVLSFISLVKGMTHPLTGYLTQSPHLANAMGPEANITDWNVTCNIAFEWLKTTLKQLEPQKRKSRDPFEPIKDVLEMNHPMDAVGDMIQRMKGARPATGGLTEAIWARDILLIKLLASNPLRAKNIKLLTYTSDNTGQLYKTRTGAWRILIQPDFLKNQNGAARDKPYDMPVHESLWNDIERYLKRYRPLLPHADKLEYVFLSSEAGNPPAPWDTLNRRVFKLTKCYLFRCPGVGPHAFRYINGTTILKAHPGAWEVAAQVLHDKEDTVRAHYAHLRGSDGAERAHALMNDAFERM